MNSEVTRRIDLERQAQSILTQDENPAVSPTVPDAGDDPEEDNPDMTLRRGPAR